MTSKNSSYSKWQVLTSLDSMQKRVFLILKWKIKHDHLINHILNKIVKYNVKK